MLRFVGIPLGESGNSSCRRCGGVSIGRPYEAARVVADIGHAVRSWGSAAGPNLAFGGFEPFSHPDINDMLLAAAEAGVQRIRLDTDGAALNSRDTADRVIGLGVRHVRLTLLGSSAAAHDSLTGTPGSFDAALGAAHTFAEAAEAAHVNVSMSVGVPACRHNLRDLPAIVTTAVRAGISTVRITIGDGRLDPWAAAPWIEAACDSGIVHAAWVEVEGVPFGPAAGWELHLACVYRSVNGTKGADCRDCPLTGVCGGAAARAADGVAARLRPPPDASEMAHDIARGFLGPGERA